MTAESTDKWKPIEEAISDLKRSATEKIIISESETIYDSALRRWGIMTQLDIAVEECAELIKAIIKFKRKYNDAKNPMQEVEERKDKIAEEIADVEIMNEQLKIGLGLRNKVEFFKTQKLKRLLERLEEVG